MATKFTCNNCYVMQIIIKFWVDTPRPQTSFNIQQG